MRTKNDEPKPPRNYFSRREQMRLLLMFMSLGLVVLLINEARNPDNWQWFIELTSEKTGEADRNKTTSGDDLDTSYQPTIPPEVPLDEVRIRPALEPEADDGTRFFPGVVPAYLSEIEDYRPHHPSESMAWFNLWETLALNDSSLINGASSGRVSFVELFEQPAAYRGELVTIVGNVKRVEWEEAPQTIGKIKGYHKLIMRMKDGPPQPMFLYTLDLPDGFPQGDKLHEDIEVTAFFYKNWPYPGQTREWLAPVLLARDFTWLMATDDRAIALSLWQWVIIMVVLAFGSVAVAYYIYRRSRNLFDGSSSVESDDNVAASVQRLNDIEPAAPVTEQLKQLAEND